MITLNEIIDTRRVSLSTINDSINPTHPPKKKKLSILIDKTRQGAFNHCRVQANEPLSKGNCFGQTTPSNGFQLRKKRCLRGLCFDRA